VRPRPWHGPDYWIVRIDGQPPSGNHMYERNKGNSGQHKRPGVEMYQTLVTMLVREARPAGWRPDGQIVVSYFYFLGRDVDCTNAQKVIEDGIAMALRPEDPLYDRRFLPRAELKELGHKHPCVIVGLEAL
jgi:hypothetical protein